MTRETRIGLLVGVGFIITFGLVLTELTGTGKPMPPTVSVLDSTLALTPAEDISPVVVHPQEVPPALGVPLQPSPSPATAMMAAGQDAPAPLPSHASVQTPEILAVASLAPAPAPAAPAPPAAAPPAARTYTVRPGDSLIKIARKVYGPGRDEDYRRIYEANRDKLTSPSLLAVGQVLVIPAAQEAAPALAAAPVPAARSAAPPRPATAGRGGVREVGLDELADALGAGAARAPRPAGGRTVYVVQRGDTLTKIARQTLRDDSPAAVRSIYEANASTLSDPDVLPVGATLVIPG
jgi:nucleoid-associated protein YgaU